MSKEYVYRGVKIEKLVHDTVRIQGKNVVLYIDPFRVSGAPKDADIVICTHDHFDHCSPEDVLKVAKPDAIVVAALNCEGKLRNLGLEYKLFSWWEEREVKGVKIKAVPAYNVNKRFHPREYGGIGVIVEVDGVKIYHAGDTDLIEEMSRLGKIDVALLPVSGTYVMNAEEAAKAAEIIKPEVAIPMHYGAIVGSKSDAEKFAELLEGKVQVVILD